jgi:hypothetical protein
LQLRDFLTIENFNFYTTVINTLTEEIKKFDDTCLLCRQPATPNGVNGMKRIKNVLCSYHLCETCSHKMPKARYGVSHPNQERKEFWENIEALLNDIS